MLATTTATYFACRRYEAPATEARCVLLQRMWYAIQNSGRPDCRTQCMNHVTNMNRSGSFGKGFGGRHSGHSGRAPESRRYFGESSPAVVLSTHSKESISPPSPGCRCPGATGRPDGPSGRELRGQRAVVVALFCGWGIQADRTSLNFHMPLYLSHLYAHVFCALPLRLVLHMHHSKSLVR